jgi:hypothetical protein
VATFAQYALGHVSKLPGGSLVVEITPKVVKRYQADRLKEKAGPKTINDEVQLLLRLLCGEQGALIRATLRRDKALKLPLPPSPGRPYSTEEEGCGSFLPVCREGREVRCSDSIPVSPNSPSRTY